MNWILGEIHPIYGEVQMMANLKGESYRFMIKDGVVSMIPLSFLGGNDEDPEGLVAGKEGFHSNI